MPLPTEVRYGQVWQYSGVRTMFDTVFMPIAPQIPHIGVWKVLWLPSMTIGMMSGLLIEPPHWPIKGYALVEDAK